METRRLGRAGAEVSVLGLGTANFGWLVAEPEAHAILDRALELGINLIDTADSYGEAPGEGRAERIIGNWLAGDAGRRARVVLATKAFSAMADRPNARGLSAVHLARACEASLERLRTDRVDLYQMHHVDRDVGWEEIWDAMAQLRHQGKIVYVGSSNFAGWHLAAAQGVARARSELGLVSEQSVYNLAQRLVELEVLPACEGLGLGFLAYSPLAGGLLAGGGAGVRRADARAEKLRSRHAKRVAAYEAVCKSLGARPATVSLAWAATRRGVTSTLIGPRTVEQLEDAVRALAFELPPNVVEGLDALWPGTGAAPEAYAW